uniref:NADH-ubiquinone oxidoreductase chain 3 n=1 Tax=Bothropolys sp. SP-2004 TaxID=292347 RepID=A5D6J6_9MYRI|nr:NADH dehydrogenase subunit 3 [Bothropolys sp. SP-2004]
MLLTLTSLTLMFLLSLIIMTLASILSMKSNKDREKSSPFECGFSPFNSARIPFSLRFFLIAVIFLIFDVEITLLLPIPVITLMSNLMTLFFTLAVFVIILMLGLYYEWKKGALNWSK